MNPLTLVKRIQNINKREANLGISEDASWHAKYKDSAYVFVGGIPFDLTEGDLLAVFAQYGEIVDVNLVRDKGTGKSKGFAFLAYEDQRSTSLAVDNLNGAQNLGRTVRVDHVTRYKKLEEEDEETKQQKREERGVCRAFQRGECNRGDSCKFSHNEQRAANTGWGADEDRHSRWGQDKFQGSEIDRSRSTAPHQGHRGSDDFQNSQSKGNDAGQERPYKDVLDSSSTDKRSRSNRAEPSSKEDHDWRKERRSRKYESESHHQDVKYGRDREDKYGRERDRRSHHDRDASHHHRRERDE